ncbi:unnamed protein product [Ectocarpus sp. 6 AP-2014]
MASIYRTVAPVTSARRCISSSALRSQRSYGSSAALVPQRPPAIPAGALLRSSVARAGPPEGVLQLQPGHRRFGTSSSLGSFRGSPPRRGEHVMELPGLGDSISEGTVVEWRKSVGDEVSEDEVIAVVETDKVSVDVRSTHVGVVVKLFAAVDDVVEVGKPLCTIDGDEASVVKARVQAQQDEEDANAPPPKVKKPSLEDAMAGAFMAGADFVAPMKKRHKPLIKFVGKRALLTEKKGKKEEDGLPARHRHSPGALDFSQIVGGAMFGRPAMSEEEMEAVDSGGAEAAPQLRYIDGSRWAS